MAGDTSQCNRCTAMSIRSTRQHCNTTVSLECAHYSARVGAGESNGLGALPHEGCFVYSVRFWQVVHLQEGLISTLAVMQTIFFQQAVPNYAAMEELLRTVENILPAAIQDPDVRKRFSKLHQKHFLDCSCRSESDRYCTTR